MLPHTLDLVAVRVLGSLVEKELSTPDNYPLSLNALTGACNQSSNRDPVMALEEAAVSHALDVLRRLSLVRSFQGIGSRVPKYQHLLSESDELTRPERAVLCVLALRGPQTMAEVRTRASRLIDTSRPIVTSPLTDANSAEEAEAALEALLVREPSPAAVRLPRRPGQKEVRYAHLLSGAVHDDSDDVSTSAVAPSPTSSTSERIVALEELTRELRAELADVRAQLDAFRKQFE